MNTNGSTRAPRSAGLRGPCLRSTGAGPGKLRRNAGRFAALLVLTALVNSCSTTRSHLRSVPTGSTSIAPAVASQWVKVHPNPPTWYPRGTPADCPTDFRSGEWVHTEDALGSRYFIPVRGISKERRKALRKEALAARSPRKVARIAGEDALRYAGTLLAITPPGFYVWAAKNNVPIEGGGMGGASISPGSISIGNISCSSMPGGCAPSM